MPSHMEIWNSPYLENQYYRQIGEWEKKMEGLKYDPVSSIEKEIENAMDAGDLYRALMWLNRLEISGCGELTRAVEFEHLLAPVYHKRKAEESKFSCYLVDDKLPRINGDIWDYKDRHKGERCFILGTGPSLDRQDLRLLKNEITFGCNLIFRNFENMGFEPTYYTAEDYFFFKRHDKEISGISDSVKFIPNFRNSLTYNGKTIFLNVIPDDVIYEDFPFFSVNAAKRLWSAANATYLNLQLAYFMGFSEVYLLGVDHEYNFPPSLRIHNQNDMRLNGADASHFKKGVFEAKELFHFPILKRSEKAYAKAKLAYELDNRKIVNCTPGTKLEVFEKQSLETALKNKKPVANGPAQKKPDISIIIPAWNAERVLARAVESAMNQQCDYEIVIVDDASTDGTAGIAKEFTDRFANIKYIRQEKRGQGGARNKGMKTASGRYTTFLDADDTLSPNILGKAVYKMDRDKADILLMDFNQIVNGANVQPARGYFLDLVGAEGVEAFFETQNLSAWGRVYRTDFLKENSLEFSDAIFREDMNFTIPAYFHARKSVFLPFRGYNWMRRQNSLSARLTKGHIEAVTDEFIKLKSFLKKNGLLEALSRKYIIFAYRIADLMLKDMRKTKDMSEFSVLSLAFMDFLEKLDLDSYRNVAIGNAYIDKFATNILINVFRYRGKDENGPSSERRIPKFPLEKIVPRSSEDQQPNAV